MLSIHRSLFLCFFLLLAKSTSLPLGCKYRNPRNGIKHCVCNRGRMHEWQPAVTKRDLAARRRGENACDDGIIFIRCICEPMRAPDLATLKHGEPCRCRRHSVGFDMQCRQFLGARVVLSQSATAVGRFSPRCEETSMHPCTLHHCARTDHCTYLILSASFHSALYPGIQALSLRTDS